MPGRIRDAAVLDGPVFFMSYARADRLGAPGDIKRFYDDLSTIVRNRMGVAVPGFLDTTDIEPGDSWPDDLREALRTARAFVPILSPTYFDRPYCGKEWAVFSQRLSSQAGRRARRGPQLIQPVLFVRPEDLNPKPKVVVPIQYMSDRYPALYGERGLRYLLTLSEQEDTYKKFLDELADVIIRAVRQRPLTPAESVPPLDQVQSAFHDPETQAGDLQVVGAPPGTHLFAQFVYVVATLAEVRSIRQERSAYGVEGGLDWRPFLPDVDREVGMIASEVAGRERFRYDRVHLDDSLIERIATAEAENKIVVIIVDPWTVRLDPYRRLMAQLDRRTFANSVVVIVVNFSDAETAGNRDVLRKGIEATFVNRHIIVDPQGFLPWIETPADLEAGIATALANARLRVIQRNEVVRSAGQTALFVRPPVIDASPTPPSP